MRPAIFGLKLGMVLFPSFFVMDIFVYPDHKYTLLIIRMGLALYLLLLLFSIGKIKSKYIDPIIFITFFLMAVSISTMCLVTGEGFASPYYGGILQVIIATALLYKIPPKQYAALMVAIVVQHFLLLWFLPWQFKYLLINILAIGVFSLVAVFIHSFVYGVLEENKSLKGMLPICSNCKKVRDDTGYWNQIETYVQERSNAEFTHSMCPDCSDKLYGKETWYIKMKQKKSTVPEG